MKKRLLAALVRRNADGCSRRLRQQHRVDFRRRHTAQTSGGDTAQQDYPASRSFCKRSHPNTGSMSATAASRPVKIWALRSMFWAQARRPLMARQLSMIETTLSASDCDAMVIALAGETVATQIATQTYQLWRSTLRFRRIKFSSFVGFNNEGAGRARRQRLLRYLKIKGLGQDHSHRHHGRTGRLHLRGTQHCRL